MSTVSNSSWQRASLGRWALTCLRWALILIGLWFVVSGWVQSGAKYASGKTSISFEVKETAKFLFPSLTFCPDSKSSERFLARAEMLKKSGETVFPEKDISEIIKSSTYAREDFMDWFQPPIDREKTTTAAAGKIFWKTSTPNLAQAGTCYTFDPLEVSTSGSGSGISFVINFPKNLTTNTEKNQWLIATDVFLHDRDQFFYADWGCDQPSSVRIALTRLRVGLFNYITVGYSRFKALDKKEQPCSSDDDYSFAECFEKEFARRRGCQKPWLHFPELDLGKCDNVTELVNILLEESRQADWSAVHRANETGCPRPCTNSIYTLDYTYYAEVFPTFAPVNDFIMVYVYFDNFKFQYGEEYVVCDWTCLIGEVGGNLGFILGSSILTLYDVVHYKLMSKLP